MSDAEHADQLLDQVTAEYSQAMAAHLGYQLKKSDPEMFNLALMRMEHHKHVLDLERREKALLAVSLSLSLPALIVSVICVAVTLSLLHDVPDREEYSKELQSTIAAAVRETSAALPAEVPAQLEAAQAEIVRLRTELESVRTQLKKRDASAAKAEKQLRSSASASVSMPEIRIEPVPALPARPDEATCAILISKNFSGRGLETDAEVEAFQQCMR